MRNFLYSSKEPGAAKLAEFIPHMGAQTVLALFLAVFAVLGFVKRAWAVYYDLGDRFKSVPVLLVAPQR